MLLSLLLGGLVATPQIVAAIGPGDAETVYRAFNNAFLSRNGGRTYYKRSINVDSPDGTWAGSLDIMGAQDAYERTGDPDKKALINDLLTSWLAENPPRSPPWDWDGWNDDIGWFTMALIRGYQMTGNAAFLTPAKDGFDYAFGRGWDTKFNGGGIWEENPEYCERYDPPKEPNKEALSNDSLGKVACMLYQSTHDKWYLDRCRQIYNWVRATIYDGQTGRVNAGVRMNGEVNTAATPYNQGTFIDFANLLYEITGDGDVYEDAKRTLKFTRDTQTVNGIFSDTWWDRNTWADEVARGAGHFVRDHQLWNEYYGFMVQNADAILKNRNPQRGITWNGWDTPTPLNDTDRANHYVSAVAWLQFTPATKPGPIGGIRIITNQETGQALDSTGTFKDGQGVVQWAENRALNQRWQLTQNSDGTWNIINLSTWKSLDAGGSEEVIQWQTTRNNNQRWTIEPQADGYYKITNVDNKKVLDGASDRTNGAPLRQTNSNEQARQRWRLS